MDAISPENSTLSTQRIALQKTFTDYNEKNGFSYEEWVSPPADHFYADYKKKLQEIDNKMAPPLEYQS
ncbi:MAG: hypothetical protein HAW58_01475 [Candidatus Thioglobus sp.]|nr:hypothetical protein [Candidatus Thioglobus sp.]